MPERKSQLDVYRIDRNTILNELSDCIDSKLLEKLQAISNKMNNTLAISEDEIKLLSKTMVNHVIDQQNANVKGLKYMPITLSSSQYNSYKLLLYEAFSASTSAVVNLVFDRIVGKTKNNSNVSYILFLCSNRNIYAFCSGSGWQTVTRYVDTLFGLQILSRLIPANTSAINSVHYRGFTGTVAAQTTNFRKKARASEVVDFGRLCKDLSGHISVEKAKEALGINFSTKKKNVGADFKSSFKLRRRMDLAEFCSLLDKITDLLSQEPYFSIEDWLGISPLGDSSREKTLKRELIDELINRLYRSAIDDSDHGFDMFISDSNISNYMSAGKYKLSIGNEVEKFDEFTCWEDLKLYIKKMTDKYEGDIGSKQQSIVDKLKKTRIDSYLENESEFPLTSRKLVDSIHLDFVYDKRNYLRLDGKWYVVYGGLNDRLNKELPLLIKDKLSSIPLPAWTEDNEDDYIDLLSQQYGHAKMHKKRPLDQIELCDTMFFESNRLLLCHIKDNFNTTMRVLAAQVLSSAELLTDIRLSGRISELKNSWTSYSKIKNIPSWDMVEDALSGKYEIVECIVMNPGVDISSGVSLINSTIAKYELSTLIKNWTYPFHLEIALPGNDYGNS